MNTEYKQTISIPEKINTTALFGVSDRLLRIVQDSFDVRVSLEQNALKVSGAPAEVDVCVRVLEDMVKRSTVGEPADEAHIHRMISLSRNHDMAPSSLRDDVVLTHKGKSIRPKTPSQKRYLDLIRQNTITFGLGAAGTGKTFLAMAQAVSQLNCGAVSRIVLTRPIVEAGENLGFLPGTLTEKVDPYIRPLYDALFLMVDPVRANKMLSDGTIEIAPLAFMRGRTLSDSFIILDEAQNTTPEQMKMFLTRLGNGSKMVVTADETQTDLPRGTSGITQAIKVLKNIDGVAFHKFSEKDVVRNSLVSKIIEAYSKFEEK